LFFFNSLSFSFRYIQTFCVLWVGESQRWSEYGKPNRYGLRAEPYRNRGSTLGSSKLFVSCPEPQTRIQYAYGPISTGVKRAGP
jgi:hypothetical protein